MRYVLYKFVDAETAAQALDQDARTPVHEVSLRSNDESARAGAPVTAIGFAAPAYAPHPPAGSRRSGRR
jgi:hypothetical protein